MASRFRRNLVLLISACICLMVLQFFWLSSHKSEQMPPTFIEELPEEPRLVLPNPPRRKKSNSPPSSPLRIHYKFAFMLEMMGYAAPKPRNVQEKAALDTFFASVQTFAITKQERAIFVDLWLTFDRFCRVNNFQYFLFFGTLLGALRHHGMVPWDDDIDVMIPSDQMAPLLVLLMEHPQLKTAEKSTHVHFLFFKDPKKSLPRYGTAWSYPYLELHFYTVKGGKIDNIFNNCLKTKDTDLQPIVRVPFEGHMAPVPSCMDNIMFSCYANATQRCCTKNYDHRRGEDLKFGVCVDCTLLHSVFPFVTKRRRLGKGLMEEELRLNESLIARRKVAKGKNCRSI